MPAPPDILESAEDGGEDEGILRGGVNRCPGRDAVRLDIPHYFQRGF